MMLSAVARAMDAIAIVGGSAENRAYGGRRQAIADLSGTRRTTAKDDTTAAVRSRNHVGTNPFADNGSRLGNLGFRIGLAACLRCSWRAAFDRSGVSL